MRLVLAQKRENCQDLHIFGLHDVKMTMMRMHVLVITNQLTDNLEASLHKYLFYSLSHATHGMTPLPYLPPWLTCLYEKNGEL